MNRQALVALAATSPLVGCASRAPTSSPQPGEHVSYDGYQANERAAWESLARLADLQVVEVGALIVDAPAAAGNCYGPCEDNPVDQAWMVAHARQVGRLTQLVELAVELDRSAPDGDWSEAQAALQGLDALRIVEFEGLYRPADASCDAGSCPDDPHRAGVVEALAARLVPE